MRFVCENCLAQYTIKDEKIKPQGVKVRCKKCSHVMTLRLPESEADLAFAEEATIRMPLPEEEDEENFFMDALVQTGEDPSSSPADLGSLFDDPELKAPASGLFGALDDEELGDAFERAISQRQASSAKPAPSALPSEPSVVVSQGLSQAVGVEWFVAVDDDQVGPLDIRGIKSHWRQGKIGRDSLCWKSGMRDWVPIGSIEELFEQLNVHSAAALSAEFVPSPESTAAPVEWKPSAASALASLVQDELQGMTVSSTQGSAAAVIADTAPYAAASEIPSPSATLSLPPAPAQSTTPPPAPVAYAASLSMPPAPSASAPAAIYLPPVSPPSHANKAMWAMAAALLVVALAVVGLVVAFMRGSDKPAPSAVVQAPTQVPTPPPPPPPVVETPPPPPPVVPEPPLVDSSQVLAQQLLPPPTRQPPRATSSERRAPARSDSAATAPTRPPPSPPAGDRIQDDFDKAFGGSGASSSAPAKRPERQTTVYVPPAPGGGAVKQSLSDADIMEYILTRRAEVANCAKEQRAKNPNVKGNMVIEWNIATSGRTSQVRLATPSNFQGTHFADCVMKLVQNWQFPAHRTAGGTRKFNFKI